MYGADKGIKLKAEGKGHWTDGACAALRQSAGNALAVAGQSSTGDAELRFTIKVMPRLTDPEIRRPKPSS